MSQSRPQVRVRAQALRIASSALLAMFIPGLAGAETAVPPTKEVEDFGSGWPKSLPLPKPDGGDLPASTLSKLSMQTAVDLAHQRNPVVRESYENLIATQNSLGSAYATWWPVVNANLNGGQYGGLAYYNYIGALQGVGSPPVGPYGNTTSFSSSYFESVQTFDITWNLFDPVRTPTIWQNKYLVRQAVDTYVIARRDNKLQTEQAFINLQSAIAQVMTGQQLVANDQLLYGIASSRVRLGIASNLELAKQQTVLKTDQVNLVNAQANKQVSQAQLAEQLAVINAAALNPVDALAPIGSWTHSLDATLTSAMSYRKVLEQQLTAVQVNRAQAQIQLAVYRPTIALVNSLYWTKGIGYTALGGPWVGSARSDLWNGSALLQMTFTGFDGGQARMSAAASERKAKAAEAAYQSAVNQVRREVQTYFSQAQLGRESVLLASGRVKAATEALRLQTLRFNAGYGTVTDVVQAQQDLTQGVSAYINVLTSYNTSLVNLARASGLSYSPDQPLLAQVGNPLTKLSLPARLSKLP